METRKLGARSIQITGYTGGSLRGLSPEQTGQISRVEAGLHTIILIWRECSVLANVEYLILICGVTEEKLHVEMLILILQGESNAQSGGGRDLHGSSRDPTSGLH